MANNSPLNQYPYSVRKNVETAIVCAMWVEDKGDELLEKIIRHDRNLMQIKRVAEKRLAILEKEPATNESQIIEDEIVAWQKVLFYLSRIGKLRAIMAALSKEVAEEGKLIQRYLVKARQGNNQNE